MSRRLVDEWICWWSNGGICISGCWYAALLGNNRAVEIWCPKRHLALIDSLGVVEHLGLVHAVRLQNISSIMKGIIAQKWCHILFILISFNITCIWLFFFSVEHKNILRKVFFVSIKWTSMWANVVWMPTLKISFGFNCPPKHPKVSIRQQILTPVIQSINTSGML